MPISFLARHYDPALLVEEIGQADLVKLEVERIQRAMVVVLCAGSIPRRLGGDATSEELALDKKRSRRVLHALNQSFRGWTAKTPKLAATNEAKVEGAVIEWLSWRDEHIVEVEHRLRSLATWAIQKDEEAWGKHAVVRLENEIGWVRYALRD